MNRLFSRPFAVAALVAAALAAPALGQEAGVLYGPAGSSQAHDWSGFYAGVMGTGVSQGGDGFFGFGPVAGVNAGFDYVLVGAEISVMGLADPAAGQWQAQAQMLGRAGFALSDEILLYGAGGYGAELTGTGQSYGLFGGGVEVAFSDTLSFRGQYLYGNELDGGADQSQVSLGTIFNF